jgi:hypothetical protein
MTLRSQNGDELSDSLWPAGPASVNTVFGGYNEVLIGRGNIVTWAIVAEIVLVHAQLSRELAAILPGQCKAAAH